MKPRRLLLELSDVSPARWVPWLIDDTSLSRHQRERGWNESFNPETSCMSQHFSTSGCLFSKSMVLYIFCSPEVNMFQIGFWCNALNKVSMFNEWYVFIRIPKAVKQEWVCISGAPRLKVHCFWMCFCWLDLFVLKSTFLRFILDVMALIMCPWLMNEIVIGWRRNQESVPVVCVVRSLRFVGNTSLRDFSGLLYDIKYLS